MSNQINDGGPAFPVVFQHDEATSEYHGMSIRDYFAAKAMQSVQPGQIWSCEEIAVTCHRMADAMLKAREVKP